MDARCRIELLGGLRVRQGERIITRFRTQKFGVLLAYLAFYQSQSHPREVLMEMLWPEVDPAVGRQRLSMALSSLRHQLEPSGVPAGAIIQADRFSVRLNPDAIITDVAEFEAALRQADSAGAGHTPSLQRAVDLYRGPLLPGYYEDWITLEQVRLSEAYWQAIRRLIDTLDDLGEWDRAIAYARQAIQDNPLREEAHQELIRLLVEDGQSSAARRQYRELERLLLQELGERPSETTRALVEQPARIRQKGRGRKRLTADTQAAAPLSALPSERPNASLPLQFTRFFGREEEITRLEGLLGGGGHAQGLTSPARLVTLTGTGGAGKTRLAIAVAERLAEPFHGAIWFVPLQNITDPHLIPGAIMDALHLTRSPNTEPLEQIVAFLHDRGSVCPSNDGGSGNGEMTERRVPTLLVLDNFEQLATGGAPIVLHLIKRIPSLVGLVTSRRRLGLESEREFPVAPLPTPDIASVTPERLVEYACVQLFLDRAQAVRPDFALTVRNAHDIVALCVRLEGIPLAIELAAARANVLTPSQMLAQLEYRFDLLATSRRSKDSRHWSLWATLEWSYHLLGPNLKQIFAQLSVFRGGWTVKAAEAVCETSSTLDDLARLRDCSLILAEEHGEVMRFRMLDTLREFADGQLTVKERTALRRRHADYHVGLTGQLAALLDGSEQGVWLERWEAEHHNVRAALEWFGSDSLDPTPGLGLAAKLFLFWESRGYHSEARKHLEILLSRQQNSEPTRERSSALYVAGNLARQQGDYAAANRYFQEALPISRATGDQKIVAYILTGLGLVANDLGDYSSARSLFEESLAAFREMGDQRNIAGLLSNLGLLAEAHGDYESARSLLDESLEIFEDLGDIFCVGIALNNLGLVSIGQGDSVAAEAFFEKSLAICRKLGDRPGIAQALDKLGACAGQQHNLAAARAFCTESLAIYSEMEDKHGIGISLANLAQVAVDEGDVAAAGAFLAESLAIHREIKNMRSLTGSLMVAAALAIAMGQMERAANLLGHADALRETVGLALNPWDQKYFDNQTTTVQAALGETFAAAWTEGRAMTLEQAIAYALEENT